MVLLKLFWMFFKIGLFSFGGGYAMIPMIQKELSINGWMAPAEFADVVAISEMTPGPIAVNSATYVGFNTAGVAGSFVATLGVSLPSFILVILIVRFFEKFRQSRAFSSALKGIRPATIGLMGSAVLLLAGLSIFTFDFSSKAIQINPAALVIFLLILAAVKKFKLHPIAAVIASAAMGIILL
jgi:chromate transporter